MTHFIVTLFRVFLSTCIAFPRWPFFVLFHVFPLVLYRIGFSAAFDTLLTQANGAKLYPLQGLIAQRGIIILSLAAVPVAALIWFWTETLLLNVIKLDLVIAAFGQRWARILLHSLWPNLMLNLLTKFMQVGWFRFFVVLQRSSVGWTLCYLYL